MITHHISELTLDEESILDLNRNRLRDSKECHYCGDVQTPNKVLKSKNKYFCSSDCFQDSENEIADKYFSKVEPRGIGNAY